MSCLLKERLGRHKILAHTTYFVLQYLKFLLYFVFPGLYARESLLGWAVSLNFIVPGIQLGPPGYKISSKPLQLSWNPTSLSICDTDLLNNLKKAAAQAKRQGTMDSFRHMFDLLFFFFIKEYIK